MASAILSCLTPGVPRSLSVSQAIRHCNWQPSWDGRGFFTWDGNYYALNLTEHFDVEKDGGFLRIGLAHYNTAEEVDRFLRALREITSRSKAEHGPSRSRLTRLPARFLRSRCVCCRLSGLRRIFRSQALTQGRHQIDDLAAGLCGLFLGRV